EVNRLLPRSCHSVALVKVPAGTDAVGLLKPIEIITRITNHFFGKIGAVGAKTEQSGFLKDDARTAERIEETRLRFLIACKSAPRQVDHHKSQFWRQHANKSI